MPAPGFSFLLAWPTFTPKTMPTSNNLAEQKHLGYVLHPPRRPSEPGYSRLDALLLPQPSGQHFDPYFLRLWVATGDGKQADRQGISHQTIEHPWNGEERLRVCAGQVDLVDRYGKQLDAFTFGGELRIDAADEHTGVALLSPAPILLMHDLRADSGNGPVATLLAQETEILLAQRRAFWEATPEEFEQRLARVEPLKLYLTCLQAIQQRFTRLPSASENMIQQFRHMLRLEIRAVQEQAPGTGSGGLLESTL